MYILFVHYSARIACRYAIHRSHACRIVHDWFVPVLELFLRCGFVLCIRLWFMPVMTHVSPYSFLRSNRTLALQSY